MKMAMKKENLGNSISFFSGAHIVTGMNLRLSEENGYEAIDLEGNEDPEDRILLGTNVAGSNEETPSLLTWYEFCYGPAMMKSFTFTRKLEGFDPGPLRSELKSYLQLLRPHSNHNFDAEYLRYCLFSTLDQRTCLFVVRDGVMLVVTIPSSSPLLEGKNNLLLAS
ncbi:hypothetical protein PENVUL_c001G10040 [Penicillium vulpinum]|uniref:Uncharacterized protein n=1 Tax=Penicillium vulpinum TaxID=29845 RepID=A0A1V6SFM1_9EURO|nr:hypothetical protein PENVUL_c001G10040 [Penicillium vulpinum]